MMTFRGEFSACQAPPPHPRALLAAVHVASLTTELLDAVSLLAVVAVVHVDVELADGRLVVGYTVVNLLLKLALAFGKFAGQELPPPLHCCWNNRNLLMSTIERCDQVVVFSTAAEVWLVVHSNLSSHRHFVLEFENHALAVAVH